LKIPQPKKLKLNKNQKKNKLLLKMKNPHHNQLLKPQQKKNQYKDHGTN
jgi:hypothetical protein